MIKKSFSKQYTFKGYMVKISLTCILSYSSTKKVCKQQNIFVKPIKQYTVTLKKNGKSYLTIERWERTHINVCILMLVSHCGEYSCEYEYLNFAVNSPKNCHWTVNIFISVTPLSSSVVPRPLLTNILRIYYECLPTLANACQCLTNS